jgi:Porin subfamily
LKIGGNAHFEYQWIQPITKSQDTQGTRSQGQITFDARNNTEYGLLRSFVSLGLVKRNGTEQSGSQEREGNATTNSNAYSTAKQTFFNYQAYVQFGGLTVGRTASFAQSPFGFNDFIGSSGVDARDPVSTVAYTMSLGNGFRITAALEDGTESNRDGVYTFAGTAKSAPNWMYNFSPVGGVTGAAASATAGQNIAAPALLYGGNRIPDAVLALDLDQAWGSAHLAGMTHAINYSGQTSAGGTIYNGTGVSGTTTNSQSTDYGYGFEGAIKFKLDMIAPGDTLTAQATYAKGFNQMVFRNVIGDRNGNDSAGMYGYNPGWYISSGLNDVAVDVVNNKSYLAQSYGGAGEFTHYFTPTVAAFVGGGYAHLGWDAVPQAVVGSGNHPLNPANTYNVYLGAIWTPVKGFKISPMVEYDNTKTKYITAASGAEPATKTFDMWQARVRVTREF